MPALITLASLSFVLSRPWIEANLRPALLFRKVGP